MTAQEDREVTDILLDPVTTRGSDGSPLVISMTARTPGFDRIVIGIAAVCFVLVVIVMTVALYFVHVKNGISKRKYGA